MFHSRHNTDFIKNARYVWKDTAPEIHSAQEMEAENEDDAGLGELMENIPFLQKVSDQCEAIQGEGDQIVENQMCSLLEAGEAKEMFELRDFVDELGEKFLKTLQGEDRRYQSTDFFKRYQLLQEITDFNAIVERYKKAESYEIKPGNRARSTSILFTYRDGTTEEYPLELSFKRKRKSIGKGLRSILKGSKNREGDKESREREPFKALEEFDEKKQNEWREKMEDIISRAHYLQTPEDVHHELRNITTHLPDDLLETISGPISKHMQAFSNATVNYEGIYGLDMSDEDTRKLDLAEEELNSAFKEYYPSEQFAEDMDNGQLFDLLKILEEFELD